MDEIFSGPQTSDPACVALYPQQNFWRKPCLDNMLHDMSLNICLGLKALFQLILLKIFFFTYNRQFAHGEVLGVSLLMEDVLMSGQQDKALTTDLHNENQNNDENTEKTVKEDTSLSLVRKKNGLSKKCSALKAKKINNMFLRHFFLENDGRDGVFYFF